MRRPHTVLMHLPCLFLVACFVFVGLLPACPPARSASPTLAGARAPSELIGRIDASLARAARFLAAKQSRDGAWRSEVYGPLRDGTALTPHVLEGLAPLVTKEADVRGSFRAGVVYLVRFVGADGTPRPPTPLLPYRVYTSAAASRMVVLGAKTETARRAQGMWLALLREHQLAEPLGWRPSDSPFGGWGYALHPSKPAPDRPALVPVTSNLSATAYALEALATADVTQSDPVYRKALVFARRCQNFAEDARTRDPRFDDGGFFFAPGDAARNKAGVAGRDRRGRQRFASYGGATADGLRALLLCGVSQDHPRVAAARRWLERNFVAGTNPGAFARDREVIRDATYHYYCRSVALAFTRLGSREVATKAGKVRWAEALAEELIRRQRPDGAWVNRFTDSKEDDPLVATPLAAVALAACRQTIMGR